MANVTRNVPFTKSAYAKESYPNNVYATNTSTEYNVSSDAPGNLYWNKIVFGGANSWPDSLKRNRIISARLRVYLKTGYSTFDLQGCVDFTPSEVTYRNFPEYRPYSTAKTLSAADLGLSQGVWADVWIPLYSSGTTDASKARRAVDMLQNGAVYFAAGMWSNLGPAWYMKTVLSGGTAPYVEITYSDSEIITSKAEWVKKLDSTVYPNRAQAVSWQLVKNSSNRCFNEVWTQSSAKFRWRVSGSSSWNDIDISGPTTQLTIPAYTFPTGKTIYYCIQSTDTDGTTTTTATYTTTTTESKITPQNSPTSGYKNPREDITFSWYFANTAGNYEQSSASLFWRESGTDTWTQIDAAGSTKSLTVPANTFPTASAVEWYLSGTDSSGSASQTDVYTFSTTASTAYATVVRPVNSVEDGSAPITFKWTLQSADGLEMSRVNLWWKLPSEDNQSWHVIKSSTEIITEWTVDAGYFPAGEIEWLVHAYNIDGTRGPDSKSSFICVDAPDPVQGLTATAVPLTTISWQSEGQEAYEISIDGEVVKKAYGVGVYSWKVTEPLEDGEHTISVRIQGLYGLWSQPSVTSILVSNSPPWEMYLSGEFTADARLKLDLNGNTINPLDVRWYRDDTYIAWTTGTLEFEDRFVLGQHRYHAEIWIADGNYIRSNDVIGKMSTDATIVALAAGGEWLNIGLSENSADVQQFSWSRTVALLHVCGSVYPIMETSPFEDLTGSYNCAFVNQDDAARFEALRGHPVIIKSRRGNVITGAIVALTKKETNFYTSYTFNVQRLQWEDFVRDDQTA